MIAHNGVVVGGEDFDYVQPALVRAVKELFPSDPVIQSLIEGGCVLPTGKEKKNGGNEPPVPAGDA